MSRLRFGGCRWCLALLVVSKWLTMTCMGTVTFDTLKFANRLKDGGVPEAQAEAEALAVALAEAMDNQIATKRDTDKLDARLNLVQWMIGFNLAFTMAVLWKVLG